MGFLICEDAWHLSSALILWQDGADIFLHIASNPGYGVRADLSTLGNNGDLQLINRTYAEMLTVYVAHGPAGTCGATCEEWLAVEGTVDWDGP